MSATAPSRKNPPSFQVALGMRRKALLQKVQTMEDQAFAADISFVVRQSAKVIERMEQDRFRFTLDSAMRADPQKLLEWLRDAKRRPATAVFAEGPERDIAVAVEALLRPR